MIKDSGIWKRFLPALLVLALCSCGVQFDTAMPAEAPALTEFPVAMTGTYHLADSFLVDKKDTIYNAAYDEQALAGRDSVSLFDVALTVKKQMAYYTFKAMTYCKSCSPDNTDNGMRRKVSGSRDSGTYKRDGYTVSEKWHSDTIINLKHKDKLKHHGKTYYLNHVVPGNKAWEIMSVTAGGRDSLLVGLTDLKDKKYLERFIVKKSALSAVVHLSDEQFYRFVTQGGFHLRLSFKKYDP